MNYLNYNGSNRGDILGPVMLQPLSQIPHVLPALKEAYLGSHRVLAGGKYDSSEDGDIDAEQEPEAQDSKTEEPDNTTVPLSYHCMPLDPMLDLINVNLVKRVIDLTPTCCPLALALVERGISYAAFCSSEEQKKFLQDQLLKGIVKSVQTPGSKLYDLRFALVSQAAAPFTTNNKNGQAGGKPDEVPGGDGGDLGPCKGNKMGDGKKARAMPLSNMKETPTSLGRGGGKNFKEGGANLKAKDEPGQAKQLDLALLLEKARANMGSANMARVPSCLKSGTQSASSASGGAEDPVSQGLEEILDELDELDM